MTVIIYNVLGTVDGIGGTANRHVWLAVSGRKFIINDATSFVSCAQSMKGVSVEEITDEETTRRHKDLGLANIFEEAAPITGIPRVHHFRVLDSKVVPFTLSRDSPIESSITMGDGYVVEYEGSFFPGEVIAIGATR